MVDIRARSSLIPATPTMPYEFDGPELDLYDAVTEFVSKSWVKFAGAPQAGVRASHSPPCRDGWRPAPGHSTDPRSRVRRLEKALEDIRGVPSDPEGVPGSRSSPTRRSI